MTLATQDLTLAAATLSGGARLLAAGSGYPARITPADDTYFEQILNTNSLSGVAIDPDKLHIWIVASSTTIRKIRISDGSVIATFTSNASSGGTRNITTAQNLYRLGTLIYFANASTGNYLGVIDTAAMTCQLYAQATVVSPVVAIPDGTGKVWARTGNTGAQPFSEFTLSGTGDTATATATGRTFSNGYGACPDGGAGVYIYFTNSTNVVRYKISDGTTTTNTVGTTNFPGILGFGNTFRNTVWDYSLAQPLVWQGNAIWSRFKPDLSAIDGPALGLPEYGFSNPSNSNMCATPYAWSDDGLLQAWIVTRSATTTGINDSIKTRSLGVQRARWTYAPGQGGTLKKIFVPGDLANIRGLISNPPAVNSLAFGAASFDYRVTKVFYQIGAAARVEYKGGDLAAAFLASDTLTIDVDFQYSDAIPKSPAPYVGGDSGEGLLLLYDTAVTRRRNRLAQGM
jgi:hypothetical protein